MKKFTLVVTALLFFVASEAQFSKGDRYLSGSFSFSHSKNESSATYALHSFSIGLSPSIMKFKSPKKTVGFRIAAKYDESTTSLPTQTTDQVMVGAGVFAQHILPLGKGFYLYAERGLDLSYTWANTREPSSTAIEYAVKYYSGSLSVTPGVGYKLTDRLIINLNFRNVLNLNYSYYHQQMKSSGSASTTNGHNFNLNSSLNNTTLGDLAITFGWKLK
jgi:hypothetical protein